MGEMDNRVRLIHEWAHRKGFWKNGECRQQGTCEHASGSMAAALMLVVSELGEAVEALRNQDRENFQEEITDAVIRLFDIAGGTGIHLSETIAAKMAKNEKRPWRHGKDF